jgi:hypothetical protein
MRPNFNEKKWDYTPGQDPPPGAAVVGKGLLLPGVQVSRNQNDRREIQEGRWLNVDFNNITGFFRPQITEYQRQRPNEYRHYSRSHREEPKPTKSTREFHRHETPQPSVLPLRGSNRARKPVLGTDSPTPRRREEVGPKLSSPRKPRKRSHPEDSQNLPVKKKRAPATDKVKYESWTEIAHWLAVCPEIPARMSGREYAKTFHTAFGRWPAVSEKLEKSGISRNDPNIHLLSEFEIQFAEKIGFDLNKFLIQKLLLFHRNFTELRDHPERAFNKTRAQQAGQCDVNNMSKYFEIYSMSGLLTNEFMAECVNQKWDEQGAKETLKEIGIEALQDPETAPAALQRLRESNRKSSVATTSPSGEQNTPASAVGSTTSPSNNSNSSVSPTASQSGESDAASETPATGEPLPDRGNPTMATPIYERSEAARGAQTKLF